MNRKQLCVVLLLMTSIYACTKTVPVTDTPFEGFKVPSNFPAPAYHFDTNPVTRAGFELGRKLFYDPVLSRDNTISCNTCHIQTSAFTQHGHSVSHGIEDRLGTRNSLPIMNLAWNQTFMWDGGIFDLDLQPIAPITGHVEMDNTVENILQKLEADPSYPLLFKAAFGTAEITSTRFLKALSQFMVMCVSANSKYDSVMRKETAFTAEEQAGYLLYRRHCSTCHTEPLFTDQSFRNNGLLPSAVNDLGRYTITLRDTDMYKFRVPTLRNLDYTAPYMHDGRLLSLDAVLRHYMQNITQTTHPDPLLQNGIALTEDEKTQILAFLKTLNDRSFLFDTRFSAP